MSLPDPEYTPNVYDPLVNETYEGEVYAFNATGGFTMERGFDTIKLAEQDAPVHVDVTNAIQITMDVATFNAKLDLTSFDPVTDAFGVDDITISAEDFTAGVTNASQVLSVGIYSTLYSDFQTYVATYFGIGGGFSSLFVAASEFAIDKDEETNIANVFDGASFVALLTASAQDPSGRYISDLSGSINIANIAKLLKYSVDGNVFGNRNPEDKNWGIADGFVPGDLIWIPEGTTIILKLAIDPEALNPLNNVGAGYGSATAQTQSQTTSLSGTNFTLETEANTELITRTATAPLLIKLVAV
jgi:hypothetical protein